MEGCWHWCFRHWYWYWRHFDDLVFGAHTGTTDVFLGIDTGWYWGQFDDIVIWAHIGTADVWGIDTGTVTGIDTDTGDNLMI